MKCWQTIVESTMCNKLRRASQSHRSLFDIPHLLWDLDLCSDLALCEIFFVFTKVSGQEETWLSDRRIMDETYVKIFMSILGDHLDVIRHADVQRI